MFRKHSATVLTLILLALLGWVAPQAAAEAGPLTLARMYSLGSRPVWNEVVALLDELALETETLDSANQIAFTRTLNYADERFENLLTPELRKTAGTFQLQVFVSPFVEPARVYMGSISHDGVSVTYNAGVFEAAFLKKLGDRLGEPGRTVPDPDEKLGAPGDGASKIETPKKLINVQALYPGPTLAARRKARVILESVIAADGATTCFRPIAVLWDGDVVSPTLFGFPGPQGKSQPVTDAKDEPLRRGLMSAAMGAVSLWRYRPLFVDGHPVPVAMTVIVPFSQ